MSSGKLDSVCSADGRDGDGGGKLGSGFAAGYAGGGAGGDEEKGGRGGGSTVVILVSEMVDWTVRLVKDVDGCERAREEPRGGNDCATSESAESGKLAQKTSSNASNGRKRSCESRDARRAGSNSDGSRE
jgi:hypothetical protein